MITFLVIAIIFGIVVLWLMARLGRPPRRPINQKYFQEKWSELLARVTSPDGMILAVIDADKLLDEALRKKNFRGKTTGERLVSAQRAMSNNDGVWYAHKLRNRLVHEPSARPRKREVQNALAGFKQGLKDLGAL